MSPIFIRSNSGIIFGQTITQKSALNWRNRWWYAKQVLGVKLEPLNHGSKLHDDRLQHFSVFNSSHKVWILTSCCHFPYSVLAGWTPLLSFYCVNSFNSKEVFFCPLYQFDSSIF
jgi:hypothetical protein